MNGLLIGRCPKTAEQMSTFCNETIIVLDESFAKKRNLPELKNFKIIHSEKSARSCLGIFVRAKEIVSWVDAHDIDVLFTNTKWDMIAAKIASFFTKKKTILCSASHNSYAWQNFINVFIMSILIRVTTDIYIALASFVERRLLKFGLKERNLILLPNTIDGRRWQKKTNYMISNRIRLVYLADVYPEKRQDFILNLIRLLQGKYDIEADCYGEKSGFLNYVEDMEKKSESWGLQDRFRLLGQIENESLRLILKDYDIYISPSKMEMSPVNILEAQAVGLPVIAANVGGVPDLITHNETGLLFEVDNLQDAAKKLSYLIENIDLRKTIGKSGRKYVSDIYNKQIAGKRLEYKIKNAIFSK